MPTYHRGDGKGSATSVFECCCPTTFCFIIREKLKQLTCVTAVHESSCCRSSASTWLAIYFILFVPFESENFSLTFGINLHFSSIIQPFLFMWISSFHCSVPRQTTQLGCLLFTSTLSFSALPPPIALLLLFRTRELPISSALVVWRKKNTIF